MEITNIHSKKKMYLCMTMKPFSKNKTTANTTNMNTNPKGMKHRDNHQVTRQLKKYKIMGMIQTK
jgi:hypothetical protein